MMQISREIHETDADHVTRQTITIEIEPGDDPAQIINGLLVRGRLGALMRMLGQGHDLAITDSGDLAELLTAGGYVAGRIAVAHELLMWAARDTWGASWRHIAARTEVPVSTVRRRVAAVRAERAEAGWWRDAEGLHRATPQRAAERAMARAAALDSTDPRRRDEEPAMDSTDIEPHELDIDPSTIVRLDGREQYDTIADVVWCRMTVGTTEDGAPVVVLEDRLTDAGERAIDAPLAVQAVWMYDRIATARRERDRVLSDDWTLPSGSLIIRDATA